MSLAGRAIAFLDRPAVLFSVASVAWLAANARHLADPPYWDGVIGLYAQAAWLARNDFDYTGLLREPSYWAGGANLNPFSALAPLVALLWTTLGIRTTYVVLHLATVAFAAACTVAAQRVLRDAIGAGAALLWCAAAALDPIWSGQVAAIYTEVPVATFAMVAVLAVWRRWWFVAAAAVVGGFFVKQSIVILAIAFWIWLPIDRAIGGRLGPTTTRARLALLLPAPLLVLLASSTELGLGTGLASRMTLGELFLHWLERGWLYFPWRFLWLAITVLAAIVVLARPKLARAVPREHASLMALFAITIGGFWASYVLASWPLPRYGCFVVFPTFALLAMLVSAIHPVGSRVLAAAILVQGALNQTGALLPRLENVQEARSGYRLERSRAYLDDLAGDQAICAFLDEHSHDATIVTKLPFTYLLTLPELGYVKTALPHVVGIGRTPVFADVPSLGPSTWLDESTLFLYAPNVFERNQPPSLRPGPDDTVVYEDERLGAKVIVYRKAPQRR